MLSLLRVVFVLVLLALAGRASAASQVIISEFMASNSRTLADEDGSFEDWIEIYNTGATTVNLLGWSLTDAPGNLNKWRFPATNLAAGSFLLVFASEKNRTTPGSNLHTNFRLTAGGEYLALVEPDGVTLASEFAPVFPRQATDVSFGFGAQSSSTFPIAAGSPARVFVPADDALGANWTQAGFDDAGWLAATNGVGFDTGVPDPNEDSYALAVAASGPVAWYRFEEGSGTTLAIQGLNIAADNADFLLAAELVATDIGGLNPEPRYFQLPTPGAPNGSAPRTWDPSLPTRARSSSSRLSTRPWSKPVISP
jgi:hypothetical protein